MVDCLGECGGAATVDACGECQGDGSACADCSNPSWYADGYCDDGNNTEACGYDGGDCCPSDCDDTGANNISEWDCDVNGGDCFDCIDPDSVDLAVDGDCYEATVWDGAVAPTNLTAEGYDDEDLGAGVLWTWSDSNQEDVVCADGVTLFTDCSGTEFCNDDVEYLGYDCVVDDGTCTDIDSNASIVTWLGDGACDDGSFGLDLSCDAFSGDCGDCATADDPWDELDPNDYCAEIVIVEIPADWTCSDTYYTDSYCDCGCGAYDPTCDNPLAPLWSNCAVDEECVSDTSLIVKRLLMMIFKACGQLYWRTK